MKAAELTGSAEAVTELIGSTAKADELTGVAEKAAAGLSGVGLNWIKVT